MAQRRKSNSDRQQADGIDRIMQALLAVHAASTPGVLADAAADAVEIAVGAVAAFVMFEDEEGRLLALQPASEGRRHEHQRAHDAIAGVLRGTIDPATLPALADALDGGAAVQAPVAEMFAPALDDATAAPALVHGAAVVAAVPLVAAGERAGALIVLLPAACDSRRLGLVAGHIATAVASLRRSPVVAEAALPADIARSVFDARKLETELQRELARAERYRRDTSIVVIEATNLRLLREQFGERFPDQLVDRVGEALARDAREIDLIGVYKETGFAMVLTEATRDGARGAADRLLDVARSAGRHESVPGLELHLVAGHATAPADGVTTEALFTVIERRMYGLASEAA